MPKKHQELMPPRKNAHFYFHCQIGNCLYNGAIQKVRSLRRVGEGVIEN